MFIEHVKFCIRPGYCDDKLCIFLGNPQNAGPEWTEQCYHYKGSRYVTVDLLGLG